MRRIRYQVAMSLDGYIAGPNGEADWIIMDPDIDFGALFAQFDTFLLGRRTFETIGGRGPGGSKGTKTIVFSRTLQQRDYPKVTIVADGCRQTVTALRAQPGKDIWLFGGGASLSESPRRRTGRQRRGRHHAGSARRRHSAAAGAGESGHAEADRSQGVQENRNRTAGTVKDCSVR